jgi:succinoglycan biosynthesis transport protein ExoP
MAGWWNNDNPAKPGIQGDRVLSGSSLIIGGELNSAWNLQVDRIRRGKWLVLVLGLIAAAAAFAVGYAQPTTYTGWATLTTGSPNRAPEQDGVLSSGYVDYFNSSGYQNKFRASAQLPTDVTLRATTAAASPIVYIEATSASPDEAAALAAAAAKAFRDDINAKLRAVQDETIAAVRKPFDDVRLANGVSSDVSLNQLQDRINQINADTTNKLITLQLDSGVTENSRRLWPTVLLALIGGWVVGCVLAVAGAMLSRRLRTRGELAAKVGLSPIVEVPAPRSNGSRRVRAQRFQQLVNAVSLADLPDRATVTVTSTVASGGCLQVARALAQGRAAQGVRTVLINADLHNPEGFGLGDIIADESVDLDLVVAPTEIPNLVEIESGSTTATPFAAITYQRFTSLLARLDDRAECVVVAAPPISEAAETQILCAAADGVLLVVDSSASRVPDAAESVRVLEATTSCGCATRRAMSATCNAERPAGCRRSKLIGTVLIDGCPAQSGDVELGIGARRHRATKARATKADENGKAQVDKAVVTGGVEWRAPSHPA